MSAALYCFDWDPDGAGSLRTHWHAVLAIQLELHGLLWSTPKVQSLE